MSSAPPGTRQKALELKHRELKLDNRKNLLGWKPGKASSLKEGV